MDRYEPAFVKSVDELEFLQYIKDIDDQDVLDSLSVMRRRAGLPIATPPPPLQIDSGYYDSRSDDDEDGSVVGYNDDDNDDDDRDNQVTFMACYRVQIQSDNGLALSEHNKYEVSRYAYDETLQQDYLEEFDFVSVHEDDQDVQQKVKETLPYPEQARRPRERRQCKQVADVPEPSSEVDHSDPSFLSSLYTLFWDNKDRIEKGEPCQQGHSKHNSTILQTLYTSKVDSSLLSSEKTETAEFEGTLNALSSVFSGVR